MINILNFYEAGRARGKKILDLDFQNSFVDSTGFNTMIAGGSSNLPTFALSGRKAGEYCAVFNGTQSIKTNANLIISSMKLTIAFWIKTTQTSNAIITELSNNTTNSNSFGIVNNFPSSGNIELRDRRNTLLEPISTAVNFSSWRSVVMTIDRKLTTFYLKIYIDGQLAKEGGSGSELINFANNFPLFIGQRAGSSLGFNGMITLYKIYNYAFTPLQVTNLYNSEL